MSPYPKHTNWSFLFRFCGMIALPCLLLFACTDNRYRDFVPEELGPLSEERLAFYADTARVMPHIRSLRTDRQCLDSLIYFAEWLKNYDEESSYLYAEAAYNLATDRNWKFPRAISAYRLAVLKERKARFGEDLEDAMVDVNISKRIFDEMGEETWKTRTYSFIGRLFFRDKQIDSARYYLGRALDRVDEAVIPAIEKKKWKGIIQHDLAITYPMDAPQYQSYLEQSNEIYDSLNLQKNWARLQVDLGKMYSAKRNFRLADSLFMLGLNYGQATENTDVQIKALQAFGYSYALQYYYSEGRNNDFFERSRNYYNACLYLQEDNRYATYELLGWLHNVRKGYLDLDADLDSMIIYYQLAMKESAKAGAMNTLKSASQSIVDICKLPDRWEKCQTILDDATLDFIQTNYNIVLDTLIQHSKAAFQRTNSVEQREIKASAEQKRFNQLLISLSVLVIAGLIFLVLYQQQQQKRLQARMEALRAQINPHFVSNSLNAIENLINQDKKQDAAKYIIHFSRLSRQILNSSRNPNTSLKSELRTLKHFLELEKLRFPDKLNYEIVLDPDLQEELIQVPALVFQPYVENAIWHGIKPKKEPSHLRIEVKKDGKYLLGIIEDDGIGRERSRALKEKSVLQQKSMGMEITEERIQGMGKVKGAQVEVIDLRNTSGEAAGTRVQIRLPIKYRN